MSLSNEVQAALAGAILAGVLSLAVTALNQLFDLRRVREEYLRRDTEWRREKCNEAYGQAIYYLYKLQVSNASHGVDDKDVRQHLSEAQRYLSLLQAYHPQPSIRAELERVNVALQTAPTVKGGLSSEADEARHVVENLLQDDWSPKVRGSVSRTSG